VTDKITVHVIKISAKY